MVNHQLRVVRLPAERFKPLLCNGRPVTDLHPQLDATIRRHLPHVTASLLAAPSVANGHVDWYSNLSGQPVPLTALRADERARAEALLNERLAALRGLADRLSTDPASGWLAEPLRLAAVPPRLEDVFVVGGQPVVTFWGMTAPMPATATVGAASRAGRGIPRWIWALLGLLLLALLAAIALTSCDPAALPSLTGQGPSAIDPAPATPDPSSDVARAEEDALRREIQSLEEQLRARLASCTAPTPIAPATKPSALPPGPPPIQPPAAQPVTPPPMPAPPTPKPPVPMPANKAEANEPPRSTPPKQEAALVPPAIAPPAIGSPKEEPKGKPNKPEDCPKPLAKWEAPEVVLLLDASGSMGLPVNVPQARVETLYRRAVAGDAAAVAELRGLLSRKEPNRLDSAKSAAKEVVAHLPPAVDVGLVVFGECRGADNHKFFSAGQRDQLNTLLNGIRPLQGTPLARGLERAGNMMDGVTVPGVIVVVTDGEDNCNGDPCAAARALHAAKPKIVVNVVDVNGDGGGRCMAEATGGKVLTVKDYARLADVIQRATDQPRVPATCR